VALYKQASEQLKEKNKQGAAFTERIRGKHLSPTEVLKVTSEMKATAQKKVEFT
jgi:hypothetical protein